MFIDHEYIERILEEAKGATREDIKTVLDKAKKRSGLSYEDIAVLLQAEDKEDMKEVEEELEDRFSDIPKSVKCLLRIAYIKTLCKKLKIEKVRQLKDEIILAPITRYKTSEKIGYNIVIELEELLEKMCSIK